MTQPQQPQDSNTGKVITTAAVSLALIALEAKVRDDAEQAIQAAAVTIAAAAVAAAATGPLTGLALISMLSFHTILTDTLNQARDQVRAIVDSGYQAAAQLTLTQLSSQFGAINTPDVLPELGTSRDTLLRDVDLMFSHALTDIQNRIHKAYDAADSTSIRMLAVKKATDDATAALAGRADKTAATTIHRAATDIQQAVFDHYQQHTGTPGLMKRWRTTSTNPCGMCEALNGTMVGINGDFDPRATTNEKDLRPIWRNLAGPPRHPNCRCRLELVHT